MLRRLGPIGRRRLQLFAFLTVVIVAIAGVALYDRSQRNHIEHQITHVQTTITKIEHGLNGARGAQGRPGRAGRTLTKTVTVPSPRTRNGSNGLTGAQGVPGPPGKQGPPGKNGVTTTIIKTVTVTIPPNIAQITSQVCASLHLSC